VEAARAPGQRAGLTRRRVLDAAHELLGEGGLDALSMRALARRLGVTPNALYSHVDTKASLVDELLDDVLEAVETPDADGADWQAGLRTIMTSTHAVLLGHADLVPQYLARQGARGPNAQRLGVVMMALLGRGGVTGGTAHRARQALIIHAIGSAAFATPLRLDGNDAVELRQAGLIAAFDAGLRWLLAGIAADVSLATLAGAEK